MTESRRRDPIEAGLRAWVAGDLDALSAILAPDVTLRGVEPGPWDCSNRDDVLRLLRQRLTTRAGTPPVPVQVRRVDDRTYTVMSHGPEDEPSPVATRITVADGRVTAMQQFAPPPS